LAISTTLCPYAIACFDHYYDFPAIGLMAAEKDVLKHFN
jgi:hypothetical protein